MNKEWDVACEDIINDAEKWMSKSKYGALYQIEIADCMLMEHLNCQDDPSAPNFSDMRAIEKLETLVRKLNEIKSQLRSKLELTNPSEHVTTAEHSDNGLNAQDTLAEVATYVKIGEETCASPIEPISLRSWESMPYLDVAMFYIEGDDEAVLTYCGKPEGMVNLASNPCLITGTRLSKQEKGCIVSVLLGSRFTPLAEEIEAIEMLENEHMITQRGHLADCLSELRSKKGDKNDSETVDVRNILVALTGSSYPATYYVVMLDVRTKSNQVIWDKLHKPKGLPLENPPNGTITVSRKGTQNFKFSKIDEYCRNIRCGKKLI